MEPQITTYKSRMVFLTVYERQAVISGRTEQLRKNANPMIGEVDCDDGTMTVSIAEYLKHHPDNAVIRSISRSIGDEMDVAELELSLGALNDMDTVRMSEGKNVKVGDLRLRRSY